jgi:hypothetical protein
MSMINFKVLYFYIGQRRGAPEFSGEMFGWVLRGFSVGSHGYS